MSVTLARALIGGVGLVLVIAGFGLLGLGGAAGGMFSVLFLVVPGGLLLGAVLLERVRYRSLHAEQTGAAPGAGGGEPAWPEPRFRPTDERFVDPTTGALMRVWIDPVSGERRYVAEG